MVATSLQATLVGMPWRLGLALRRRQQRRNLLALHARFREHTMLQVSQFVANLEIVRNHAARLPMQDLAIVECGSWRGGMSFGMMEVVPECPNVHIFDSFEGLPSPADRDGAKAAELFDENLLIAERNVAGYEDVAASIAHFGFADRAVLHKGWFEDTVSSEAVGRPIGVLRLDGDWYDSTYVPLDRLFDQVVPGGVVIIDDYYTWPGCAQALHDFLSGRHATETIAVWPNRVAFLTKNAPDHLSAAASPEEKAARRTRNSAARAARNDASS